MYWVYIKAVLYDSITWSSIDLMIIVVSILSISSSGQVNTYVL